MMISFAVGGNEGTVHLHKKWTRSRKNITWRGTGVNEEGVDDSGAVLVQVSEAYFRPTEVETLLGDCTKAKEKLGWEPEISFKELVHEMLEFDFAQFGLELPVGARDVVNRSDQYC